MKRKLFFAATAATLLFTGCANDEYVGEVENPRGELTEITFASKNVSVTRATEGSVAADKLGKTFFVYGTKHTTSQEDGTATNDQVVFKNYIVKYESTTTSTNTKGWEYVGYTLSEKQAANITDNIGYSTAQTPKYWDLGANNGYTFYAFSAKEEDITNDYVKVTKLSEDPAETNKSVFNKGYTVNLTSAASVDNLYFADRKEVKPNENSAYSNAVQFQFRHIASKIRVGFYETIPGYSVKITKMYGAVDGEISDDSNEKFVASCPNIKTGSDVKLNVTYDDTESTINRPIVSVSDKTPEQTLTLGTNCMDKDLGIVSNRATFDSESQEYTSVWPQENNNIKLKLKLDFEMTSTDGTGEVIRVSGATAEVPAQYVAWKTGVAYTYLFKISDNTNGSTGGSGTDPAGLYPITFDAVVEDDGINEYVTTVSDPSITTYSQGSNVTSNGEYLANKEIYVVVLENNSPVEYDSNKMKLYTVTTNDPEKYPITESSVLASINKTTTNGIICTIATETLSTSTTVPDAVGNDITIAASKFTAGAAGTVYAFVYTNNDKRYAKVIRIHSN